MSILNKIIKKEEGEKEKVSKKVDSKKKITKPKVDKKTDAVKRVSKGETPLHYFEIIRRPYISEKAFSLNSEGQYVFLVADYSNKSEIKKAIEKNYKVKVAGVNITQAKSKPKRYKGFKNTRSGFKKAVVTLQKGNTIDVMEGAK
ncbi:MAG: 50S ribosomal protein L23 [Candidatus Paceibacterota bacterium]